ncbi:spermidine synthase [Cellulosimicrobium sp. NPDC057127]|uniref:spermidine synthase n=1 Tax=Cellulosimicrobium sp. NPDC057127 TaxID=3346026 RepID=UPI003634273D
MARRAPRTSRTASAEPPTPRRRGARAARRAGDLPTDEVPTTTGSARLEPDPDHAGAVTLYVNGVPSSHVDLDDPGFLAFEYMQQMAAVIDRLPPGPLRVLHLGAAGCSLARWVEHTRPGSTQVGVDLDARLLELVRTWFDLPRSPRLRLRADDARHALSTFADASFDVVVRDVFAGDSTPEHLVTSGAALDVRRVLRPGGTYLVNCADRPPLTAARRELAGLAAVVGGTGTTGGTGPGAGRGAVGTPGPPPLRAALAEPAQLKGRRYGNVVLVAVRPGPGGPDLASPGLARAARTLPVPAHVVVGPELDAFVGAAAPFEDPPDAVGHEPATPGRTR